MGVWGGDWSNVVSYCVELVSSTKYVTLDRI